jgi:hypothetical protein
MVKRCLNTRWLDFLRQQVDIALRYRRLWRSIWWHYERRFWTIAVIVAIAFVLREIKAWT